MQTGTATIYAATCTRPGICLRWTKTPFLVGGRREESQGPGTESWEQSHWAFRPQGTWPGLLPWWVGGRCVCWVCGGEGCCQVTVSSWLSGGLLDPSAGFGFTDRPLLLKAPWPWPLGHPSLLVSCSFLLLHLLRLSYCPLSLMFPRVLCVFSSLGTGVPQATQ